MTTLTTRSVPVHQEEDASLQPLPWRRMAWVTWRQHRAALAGVAAFVGAFTVYLWLTGPAAEADRYTERPVVHVRRAAAQAHLLVRATAEDPVPPGWEAHPVGLEELALAYLREPGAAALPGPSRSRGTQPSEVTR